MTCRPGPWEADRCDGSGGGGARRPRPRPAPRRRLVGFAAVTEPRHALKTASYEADPDEVGRVLLSTRAASTRA